MKLKDSVILTLKFTISGGLLFYVFSKGDIDLNTIKLAVTNTKLALLFFLITGLQMLLAAWRSFLLVQYQKATKSVYFDVLRVTWVSMFVSCMAPSSIVTDLFRIKKLLDVDKEVPTENVLYATGLTKIFSTVALVLISFFAAITLQFNVPLESYLYLQVIVFLGVFLFLFLEKKYKLGDQCLNLLSSKVENDFLKSKIENLKKYYSVLLRTEFLKILLISIIIQIANCISFVMILLELDSGLSGLIREFFYVLPLGIVAIQLPFSLLGLGIGHVAFAGALELYDIKEGADLFSIFFAFSYLFNLTGAIPALLWKKK